VPLHTKIEVEKGETMPRKMRVFNKKTNEIYYVDGESLEETLKDKDISRYANKMVSAPEKKKETKTKKASKKKSSKK